MKPKTGSRFKPLEEGEPVTYVTIPKGGWECFHCGEVFTTIGAARDHFGADPDSEPGCTLKVKLGNERGMLMAMRQLEDGLQVIRNYLNEENWDITAKPEDAISNAWDKVHELLAILQPWRQPVNEEENQGKETEC